MKNKSDIAYELEKQLFDQVVAEFGETVEGLETMILIYQSLGLRLTAAYGPTQVRSMFTDAWESTRPDRNQSKKLVN